MKKLARQPRRDAHRNAVYGADRAAHQRDAGGGRALCRADVPRVDGAVGDGAALLHADGSHQRPSCAIAARWDRICSSRASVRRTAAAEARLRSATTARSSFRRPTARSSGSSARPPTRRGLRVRTTGTGETGFISYSAETGIFTVSFAIADAQGNILKETCFNVKRINAGKKWKKSCRTKCPAAPFNRFV